MNKLYQYQIINLKLMRPDPSTTKASDPQEILLQHKEYGNKHTFTVASSTAGVLSTKAGISDLVDNGADVKGTITGEAASGRGQVLTGAQGSGSVEGIQVRYTGTQQGPDDGATVGTLTFSQNSLVFQIGGNAGKCLPDILHPNRRRFQIIKYIVNFRSAV